MEHRQTKDNKLTSPDFELLVQRELHGDVRDAKKARQKTAIESAGTFRLINCDRSVEGMSIPHLITRLGLVMTKVE